MRLQGMILLCQSIFIRCQDLDTDIKVKMDITSIDILEHYIKDSYVDEMDSLEKHLYDLENIIG